MSGAAGLSAAKRRRAGNDYTSRQEIKMDNSQIGPAPPNVMNSPNQVVAIHDRLLHDVIQIANNHTTQMNEFRTTFKKIGENENSLHTRVNYLEDKFNELVNKINLLPSNSNTEDLTRYQEKNEKKFEESTKLFDDYKRAQETIQQQRHQHIIEGIRQQQQHSISAKATIEQMRQNLEEVESDRKALKEHYDSVIRNLTDEISLLRAQVGTSLSVLSNEGESVSVTHEEQTQEEQTQEEQTQETPAESEETTVKDEPVQEAMTTESSLKDTVEKDVKAELSSKRSYNRRNKKNNVSLNIS